MELLCCKVDYSHVVSNCNRSEARQES